MAENKKSFILYADLIHTVSKLPNEKAGELFKHILEYVNDKNPETEDLLLQISFEPIKQQLKRDLKNWEAFREKQRENGLKGGRPKNPPQTELNPNNPSLILETQKSLNVTVNDNVNGNVTANEIKKNNIEERKLKFATSLIPFVETYGKQFIREFHDYWTEPNKQNRKMKFELRETWDLKLRLKTWENRQKTFTPKNGTNNVTQKPIITEPLLNRDRRNDES